LAGANCALSSSAQVQVGEERAYFDSYGTAFVQAEMLQDAIRTGAFKDAIMGNRRLFEGKVVLDVGAGTGILSLFAALAGATSVFAVERSGMASIARDIAKSNGLDDTVTVIHGLLEEVELPVQQVDIIVSEWVGTLLLHESMLDSVIYARDRWLAPGGAIVPDRATLFLAGVQDQYTEPISWNNFYRIELQRLGVAWRSVGAQQCALPKSLATEGAVILDLDLYTATVHDVDFAVGVELHSIHPATTMVHGFISWFTLGFFNASRSFENGANTSVMTTHPDAPCTHWAQTFFFLQREVPLETGALLEVSMDVRKAPQSPRDLRVRFDYGAGLNDTFAVVGAECG